MEPAANSGYELTCDGLPGGALGSGKGIRDFRVVV